MSELSDKKVWISPDEFEALQGLPALQFQLYIKLRWSMDARTRHVGQHGRGISYLVLAQQLYVEPVRGRHGDDAGSPTKSAIRSALQGLERAGLIQSVGSSEKLVLLLPKAGRYSARPNDERHMSAHHERQVSNTTETRMDAGVSDGYPQHEQQGAFQHEQHISRVKEKTYTETTSSHAEPGDARDVDPMLLLSAVQMAEWLRQAESARGRFAARIVASSQELQDWQARGLRFAQLREAYDLAVANRVATKNQAPLNPGFLRIFVDQVFSRPVVCRVERSGVERRAVAAAPLQIVRQAKRLGIEPQRADEDAEAFHLRVVKASSEAMAGGLRGGVHGHSA